MAFAGGAISALMAGLFEKKPDVPDFHWTDLVQQQLDTAQGNLDVLPLSEKIGTQVNDFMRGERAKTLTGIPGLDDIETQTVNNLKSWLRGEIPGDVSSAVQRASNARAYAGGYRGSGMGRNLTARDLGLTSLDLQKSAVPLAQQYAQGEFALRHTPEWNPASMFLDPMAAAEFNAKQQAAKYNRDWLAARIEAQPEPWQQSLMDSWEKGMSMVDSIGASYLGGMAGGMGGGGTPPPPPPSGGGSFGGYGGFNPPPNQGFDYTPSTPINPNYYLYA